MCSFGENIVVKGKGLSYKRGDTRLIWIDRDFCYVDLVHSISSTFHNHGDFIIKYDLPRERPNYLINVAFNEDLKNMLEE